MSTCLEWQLCKVKFQLFAAAQEASYLEAHCRDSTAFRRWRSSRGVSGAVDAEGLCYCWVQVEFLITGVRRSCATYRAWPPWCVLSCENLAAQSWCSKQTLRAAPSQAACGLRETAQVGKEFLVLREFFEPN